jgi:hypothetical protein
MARNDGHAPLLPPETEPLDELPELPALPLDDGLEVLPLDEGEVTDPELLPAEPELLPDGNVDELLPPIEPDEPELPDEPVSPPANAIADTAERANAKSAALLNNFM